MLVINKEYSITDLLHMFDGNTQSSMPLVNGKYHIVSSTQN